MADEDIAVNGDWLSWRRYVVQALVDVRSEQRNTQETINKLRVELAVLKVKSGLWGSLAGVIAAAAVILFDYLLKEGKA